MSKTENQAGKSMMQRASKHIVENFGDLANSKFDIRIFWVIIIVAISIVVLRPVGIPVGILPQTQAYYNYIEGVPQGGVVGWYMQGDMRTGGTYETYLSTWKHIMYLRRAANLKIVFVSFQAGGVQGYINLQKEINANYPELMAGKKYGQDFVFLGYVPGQQAAVSSFKNDIWTTTPADHFGTSVRNIPMMQNIRSWKDLNLIICGSMGDVTAEQWFVREYAGVPVPVLDMTSPTWFATYEFPWVFKGELVGIQGAWEYAALFKQRGETGWGTDYSDWQSVGGGTLLVLLLVMNVQLVLKQVLRRVRK